MESAGGGSTAGDSGDRVASGGGGRQENYGERGHHEGHRLPNSRSRGGGRGGRNYNQGEAGYPDRSYQGRRGGGGRGYHHRRGGNQPLNQEGFRPDTGRDPDELPRYEERHHRRGNGRGRGGGRYSNNGSDHPRQNYSRDRQSSHVTNNNLNNDRNEGVPRQEEPFGEGGAESQSQHDQRHHHHHGGGNQNRRGHPRRQYDDRDRQHQNRRNNQHDHRSALNPNAPTFEPSVTDSNDDHRDLRRPAKDNKPSRNQREALIEQLTRNNHECMVCCEKVRYSQPIWSCQRCFNVFHLSCIRKWVAKSDDEEGWRCPSCQSCHESSPDGYYCFCGKMKNPKASQYDVPHTCGQVCGKLKPGGVNCTHSCISQCHPGPCPSCQVQQVRECGCGRTKAQVLCGSKTILSCESTCDKVLNCGVHQCSRVCHQGECGSCEKIIKHECYCGRANKQVACTRDSNLCKFYSCLNPCSKLLTCGHHSCEEPCHPGTCGPCKTSPEAILSCPCGQTGIAEACQLAKLPKRTKCIDRIPTCGKKCLRILSCGDDGNGKHHVCQEKCHLSKECPPCKLVSTVKCRCGVKSVEIACKDLKSREEVTCGKKCNRKRSCGKHKCNTTCCIDIDHICPIVCQRPLRCGIHKCSRLCHLNPCSPCDIVSFDELSCECGASIIYPPVPCGTRRPRCQLPCSRDHPCDHPVHHPCHSEPTCPPCTVLTEKWCHGRHELRKNVMCHISSLSCGLPCKKMLSCNRHSCPKVCHAGVCLEPGEICKLPCSEPRTCGHQCGAPCHDGECPESKCKVVVDVTCPCGRRSDTLICWKRENEYDRTVTWEYHKEIKRLEEERKAKGEDPTIDDSLKQEIMQSFQEKIPKSQVLECDKECAKLERNRKLAEALQLENADTSTTTSIGTPNYSDFLMKFAKKNPQFIESVHKQLTDLVLKAKQSTKKNVTYGFISMNRDKRHVVHEYSDHFGMLSESFDEEPNRNVVCFASKEKSYLPTVSLVDAVFRPPPVRSERLKPHEDVTFRPERRAQIVGPSNWSMKRNPVTPNPTAASASTQQPQQVDMVRMNIPGVGSASGNNNDFPPLS